MRTLFSSGAIIAVTLFFASVTAHAQQKADAAAATPSRQAKPVAAHPTFERMKKLVGDWAPADNPTSVEVTYRLTGSDSALIETLFPGSPHEMVTVYHMDGEDLVLTHYCAAGNQPRMKAAKGADGKKAAFEFTGGANINPNHDGHIHSAEFTFVADDHIQSKWIFWKGGKADHSKDFDLKRVKK